MFGFLKKKKVPQTFVLGAMAKGKAVPLSEVNDPTFSEGMLGEGVAVIPEEGKFYAPCDGEIGMVFDTLHAVSLTSDFGAEVLIHVGLDTVKMNGDGFTGHVQAGDKVKKGDLMLSVDLDAVQAAGYDIVTPIIVCNTDEYAAVEGLAGKDVVPGEDVVKIQLKN